MIDSAAKYYPSRCQHPYGIKVPKKSKRETLNPVSPTSHLPLTLADVAIRAGVSPITASRALNRPEMVNQVTRDRVLEAVREMGYVPNLLAGSLASSKSRLVAVLLPTIAHSLFASTVEAIMSRLTEAGYQTLLGPTGYSSEKEEALLEAILGRRPDGIVLMGSLHTSASRARLVAANVPVVEAWDLSEAPVDMQVGFSHEKVGEHIARHFFAKGYRRFSVVTVDDPRGRRRCASLLKHLAALGIENVPVEILPLPSTWQVGREGLQRLLNHVPAPQLIVCSSDTLALGVLAEAACQGLNVPKDIAVLGFGNISEAHYSHPGLSSVGVNAQQMGRQVAEALLDRFNNLQIEHLSVDTGFTLFERSST